MYVCMYVTCLCVRECMFVQFFPEIHKLNLNNLNNYKIQTANENYCTLISSNGYVEFFYLRLCYSLDYISIMVQSVTGQLRGLMWGHHQI